MSSSQSAAGIVAVMRQPKIHTASYKVPKFVPPKEGKVISSDGLAQKGILERVRSAREINFGAADHGEAFS